MIDALTVALAVFGEVFRQDESERTATDLEADCTITSLTGATCVPRRYFGEIALR